MQDITSRSGDCIEWNTDPHNKRQINGEIDAKDIELLQRCFSTKTIHDVVLDCDKEAKQILEASLTDPSIRQAVLSLKTLRRDLELSGDCVLPGRQQTSSHNYGLQQYSMALGGLASNLSSPSHNVLKSALLCCQIFISIEQVRKNYTAMVQHIIRGLSIMREYQIRPTLTASKDLVPASEEQLPLLDNFIIKLFAAPCKFADAESPVDVGETSPSACPILPRLAVVESRSLRRIVPDMRTELTRIATSILDFLSKVFQVESVEAAIDLLSERMALLKSLESWLLDLEESRKGKGVEPVSMCFLRMFSFILKIVLLGALDASSDLHAELQIQQDLLQNMAKYVTERVKTYSVCKGKSNSQGWGFTAQSPNTSSENVQAALCILS